MQPIVVGSRGLFAGKFITEFITLFGVSIIRSHAADESYRIHSCSYSQMNNSGCGAHCQPYAGRYARQCVVEASRVLVLVDAFNSSRTQSVIFVANTPTSYSSLL